MLDSAGTPTPVRAEIGNTSSPTSSAAACSKISTVAVRLRRSTLFTAIVVRRLRARERPRDETVAGAHTLLAVDHQQCHI